MNICFLASTFPRFKGDDQSTFVFEQVSAWRNKFNQDNLYVLLPDDNTENPKLKIDGIEIAWFRYFFRKWQILAYPAILPNIKRKPYLLLLVPFFLIMQVISLVTLIKKHQIDVIYAHWVMPQGLTAFIASRITKIPYILHNHSTDAEVFLKIPILGESILKKIIDNSSLCYCVNKEQQTFLSHVSPKSTIVLRPMGLTKPEFIGKLAPKYDFGFIGRLSKKKGLLYFLKLLKKLNNKYSLIIAGEGEEKSLLLTYTKQHDLNVRFLGFVSGKQKELFFSSFKVFILLSDSSSGDKEGMPVSILEALDRGKICLLSNETNIKQFPDWNKIRKRVVFMSENENEDVQLETLKAALDKFYNSHFSSGLIKEYYWESYISEFRDDIITINQIIIV